MLVDRYEEQERQLKERIVELRAENEILRATWQYLWQI